jgi:uncharacterized protein with ATP-grasp and redox domains
MLGIRPECVPCTFSTGVRMAKIATQDLELQRLATREMVKRLSEITWKEAPLDLSYIIQRVVAEITGVGDPYREIKRRSNLAILRHYEDLKARIRGAADPLEAAVRLAIAGNIIDFGPYADIDLEQPFRKITDDLAINDFPIFRRAITESSSLLYLLDNAGEIVFDRLLIETMVEIRGRSFNRIGLVVKETPLVNDATLEDAVEAGLTEIQNASIMVVGDGGGSAPSFRSREIERWINEYDLVIFKGQANFEVFEDKRGFFLLIVKCPVIAEALGVKLGSMILKHSADGKM